MLEKEGIVQSEDEIKKMIGNAKLDEITNSILFARKYYVSYFKTINEPDPQMGSVLSESGFDERIVRVLESKKIEKFYKFQEDAIREIMVGNNVIITAPTASGKTEAFVIPVLQKILDKEQNNTIQALFVYPTKSLSKDQFPKIKKIADELDIRVEMFDGDTKEIDRKKILENPPQVIITNFDVLHYHMWHRSRFATLLNSVKFLVVDEAHVYSGIFGSNVHYIMKRLKRICSMLQIIASSATLDNALPFCEQLFGVKMKLITGSGKKGMTGFDLPMLRVIRDALEKDLTRGFSAPEAESFDDRDFKKTYDKKAQDTSL